MNGRIALPVLNQYIIYSADKKPRSPYTGQVCDPHDPSNWASRQVAEQVVAAGLAEGVGFVFTENDPYFFFDLDKCCVDGQWSDYAKQMCQYFTGCYTEVSRSGEGLHIIGRLSAVPSEHRTRDIFNLGLELYHTARYVALTGTHAVGSPDHIADDQYEWLSSTYFPTTGSVQPSDWSVGPDPSWRGPADDQELVNRMLASRSNPFSNAIPVTDLWAGVCDPDGQSEADAALVSHLSFWTGRDCDRIDRLFRQSGLMRDKWDRSAGGGRTYGQLTISKFGRSSTAVYGATDEPALGVSVPPPAEAPVLNPDEPTGIYRGGGQILTVTGQQAHFRGCVYVRSHNKVFMPDGDLLEQSQFDSWLGGYEFMIEEGNSKGTKSAWEVFTKSRSYTFARAVDCCFRPEIPSGAVITEEGRLMVNIYVPVITEIRHGDPSRFLNHLRLMLPDPTDYNIILAYMAAIVQHPGIKFQWCPLLIGMEGNGKSMIVRALSQAIGQRYTHLPNAQDLSNKFNSWLQGKLLIGIEEVYTTDRADLIETLKPMITNDRIEIQAKGANQQTGDNRANFILCSNHKDAIRKTGTDRRYAIFYTAQQEAGDLDRDGMRADGYFPKLYEWLRAEGYAIMNGYLRDYQIPDELNPATYCHDAPRTSSTAEAMTASMGVVEQEIMEQVEQGTSGFAGGWISSMALDRLLATGKRQVSRNKRKEILEGLGYIQHPALPGGRVHNALPEGGKPVLYVRAGSLLTQLTTPRDVVSRYMDAQTGATVAGQAWGQAENKY
jgi:hypothetical protein